MNQTNWRVSISEIGRLLEFVRRWREKAERLRAANLHPKRLPSKEEFWKNLMIAIATTRCRSGLGSPVERLEKADPFPLNYELCVEHPDVTTLVQSVFGDCGFALAKVHAPRAASNLKQIQRNWPEINRDLTLLVNNANPDTERAIARCFQKRFDGLGPKQSRNVLQMLGLTRYEIPLDSRVGHWFRAFGLPFEFKLNTLRRYCLILDDIQELCVRCGLLPCVLDAAIFIAHDECGPQYKCGGQRSI